MVRLSDRQCFYGRQLLWRANLYMAEAGRDWNDLNPWTGDTEWNPSGMAGGQIVKVVDVTWPGHLWNGAMVLENSTAAASVAYSLQCYDSPGKYNGKMQQQRQILEYLIQHHKQDYAADVPIKPENNPPPPEQRPGWRATTAPPSKRDPFVGGAGVWSVYADDEVERGLNGDSDAPQTVKDLWPYRPGYSTQQDSYADMAVVRSAGVDCVGFVQRSASYLGNDYTLPEALEYEWTSSNPSAGRTFPVARERNNGVGDLRLISERPEQGAVLNLDKIIPGDVVYYTGHVTMVASIVPGAGRFVRPEDVVLVEATWGDYADIGQANCVASGRTLASLSASNHWWTVGRLTRGGE